MQIGRKYRQILLAKELFRFVFPEYCNCCRQELSGEERFICSDCSNQFSFTGHEQQPDNPIHQNLSGRIRLLRSAAIFEFRKKGVIQKLLHHLKYDRQPELGLFLGEITGERIEKAGWEHPDYLVPVPIHPKKMKIRGYNQAEILCQGINRRLKTEIIPDLILKIESGSSQTKRKRLSRWENVKDGFTLNSEYEPEKKLRGKHFLLVDDVITTGATIESCAGCLLEIPEAQISVIGVASPL